jgi:class 3 adenylate cyclase
VLFVDIVGFTHMAEAMTPETIVAMLREFHEPMAAQTSPAAAPSKNA